MMGGCQFQPNATIFKLNEIKWKNKEEEVKEFQGPKEIREMMKKHLICNKAASVLFKSMLTSFPDLCKTFYRILETMNEVVERHQK